MEYFDLIRMLSKSAAIATPEQAECALFTTLEALGALLPDWLLRDLSAELPQECEHALGLGNSIRLDGRRTQRSELTARELERVQATYALLTRFFTPLLVRHLERELPAFLRRAARTLLPRAPELAPEDVSRVAPLARGGLRRGGRS